MDENTTVILVIGVATFPVAFVGLVIKLIELVASNGEGAGAGTLAPNTQ